MTNAQHTVKSMRYGDWHIEYNPPPVPFRSADWQFWHDDFDGAEDACDNRYGHAGSIEDAMNDIDDMADEAFGCPCAHPDPSYCKKSKCDWRDEQQARLAARALLTKAGKDRQ
ncbi:hypothetical protein BSL82_09685 [Tardibacter chloracetimidivorans]|uniref:Uncharacterized protein n=1 Tax=Tardibacter chloracetimidivorans TaxID=1921510 RepID=A0A1L3ZV89_9SPHN|nr:hypothetical protein [Tardibacter chloracetimidivorans]API59552.1 hypothetical protein BSL82_09685 [Tardibacter chloracetimidivorans]